MDEVVGPAVVESLKAARGESSRRPASWSPWFATFRGEGCNMGDIEALTFKEKGPESAALRLCAGDHVQTSLCGLDAGVASAVIPSRFWWDDEETSYVEPSAVAGFEMDAEDSVPTAFVRRHKCKCCVKLHWDFDSIRGDKSSNTDGEPSSDFEDADRHPRPCSYDYGPRL